MEWPATSPDLNPIENLWADLKRKIGKSGTPTSILDLVGNRSMEKVTPEHCSRLALSLPSRLLEVTKDKGGNTRY